MNNLTKMTIAITGTALAGSLLHSQTEAGDYVYNDTEDHWAKEEIGYLSGQGYLEGYTGGQFRPNQTINRAESAAVFFRQQHLTETVGDFPDVPEDFWASGKIGALQTAGIMSGYEDSTFRPANSVTRAEVAIMLANTFNFDAEAYSELDFPDIGETDRAYEAIQEVYSSHIMQGYGDGHFRPDEPITRAEFSVVLARSLNEEFREELVVTSKTDKLLDAIMTEDFETVADYAHPEEGVRFSPYVFVQADDQVFHRDELINWLADETVYLWGQEDGTGHPIEETTRDYFDRYLNNHDYLNPDEQVYNSDQNRGNTLNNIHEFFPDASYTEYYVSGDEEQYAGMDWGSNILVMQQYEGDWYLIAVVNDEWTI